MNKSNKQLLYGIGAVLIVAFFFFYLKDKQIKGFSVGDLGQQVQTAFPKYGSIECISSDQKVFACYISPGDFGGTVCPSTGNKWIPFQAQTGDFALQGFTCPKNSANCERSMEITLPNTGFGDDSNGIVYKVTRSGREAEKQIKVINGFGNNPVENDGLVHVFIILDKNLEPLDKIEIGYYDLSFLNAGPFEFDKVNWNQPLPGGKLALEFTPLKFRIRSADGFVRNIQTNLGCDLTRLVNEVEPATFGAGGIIKATNDVDGKSENCGFSGCQLGGVINYVERWDLQTSILRNLVNVDGVQYFCYRNFPASLYTVGTMETTTGKYIFPNEKSSKTINCCPGDYGDKQCILKDGRYQLVDRTTATQCISTAECPGAGERIIAGSNIWKIYGCQSNKCVVVKSGQTECSSNNECGTGSCIEGLCSSVSASQITTPAFAKPICSSCFGWLKNKITNNKSCTPQPAKKVLGFIPVPLTSQAKICPIFLLILLIVLGGVGYGAYIKFGMNGGRK